jgi:F-type H+-transporting ATPase subunit beta
MFNVLGDPIDDLPAPETTQKDPIHKKSPNFEELSTKTEIFETGIKVVDLIAPMLK